MLFFKTPRHTAVTGLVLICLLAAAFWIYHAYTNRGVVLSGEEMLAEIEAIWAELDEWQGANPNTSDNLPYRMSLLFDGAPGGGGFAVRLNDWDGGAVDAFERVFTVGELFD